MLIIFDCDGVLRSTSWEGLLKAYVAIIQHLGKDYQDFFKNLKEFKDWWNPDWHKNNEKLGIKDSLKINKIFYENYEPYISVYPWAANVLEQLSQKHLLTLLSNASEVSVKKSLNLMAKYFTFIAGHECVKRLKPSPEGINFILKKINVDVSETIIIGDTVEDVLAGKNAGVKTGAVSWGLGDWEDLLKFNPDYMFKEPLDLLSI